MKEYKRLLSNFFSLLILQGANYILPLITFPYLVRVLGVEKFGLLAFAGATIAYFNILTDYGFNLTATREVSIYRDNKEKLNEIFSSVMIIKFILMIVSFLLLLVLIFSFDKFKAHYEVFLFTFGTVIGQVLFPQWFFQGIERMKYITFLNILAKVIFTVAIFIFIHQKSDYWKVPLINSLGFIIAGIIALYIVYKQFNIKIKIQKFKTIKYYLIDGWHIFLSNIGINLYKTNGIFVLGLFFSNLIVGYFSIAKKIIDLINSISGVLSQILFPYTVKFIKKHELISFLKKILLIIVIYTLFIGIFLFVFSDNIVKLITGTYTIEIIKSLKILSFVPFIIGINIPAVHILLNIRKDNMFAGIVIFVGIFDFILNIILVPYLSYIGSCVSVLISETLVTLFLYIYVYKFIRKDNNE